MLNFSGFLSICMCLLIYRSGNLVLTPDKNSDLTENDVTTTRRCENDSLITRWPLTESSPCNNDERYLTLGWGGRRK